MRVIDIWRLVEEDKTGSPIQIAVDPDGVPVFISRQVWVEHILAKHPVMANFKDLLLSAVHAPDERFYDNRGAAICFVDVPHERILSLEPLQIRVVIKYVYPLEQAFRRTGLVSTAYPVHKGTGK